MSAKKCACGKTAFTSQKMAKEQARWIERQGKELRVYQCPLSHIWHLTSLVENKKAVRGY